MKLERIRRKGIVKSERWTGQGMMQTARAHIRREVIMTCPHCGTQIPDDSAFCENCGTRLGQNGGGAPLQQPGYRQQPGYGALPGYGMPAGGKKNGAGLILLLAAGCLAAVAIVVGAFFFMKNRKEPDGSTAKNTRKETRAEREKETKETKETSGTKTAEKETEQVTAPAAVMQPVGTRESAATLADFDWYEREGFPTDGRPMEELEELGGAWKCRISATSMVNGVIQRRYVVGDAEVQYMGYKVTLIVHVKERYEFPVERPEEIKKLETAEGVDMILEGDWNPEFGGMEVASGQSTLNMKIYDYVEAGKSQYAWGTLGDGGTDIGEVVMIRP